MHSSQGNIQLEKTAPESRLIRVINRLYNLTNTKQAREWQEKLDKLNLRHSVLSPEGRMEFIADLIMINKDQLDDSAKKALKNLSEDLKNKRTSGLTLLDFSIDFLLTAIKDYALEPLCDDSHNTALLNNDLQKRSYAMNTLIALSLTGLMASGCSQKKDNAYAYTSEKKAESVTADPDKLNLAIDEIIEELQNSEEEQQQPPATYTVNKSDSIRSIADELGLDYRDIVSQNNIPYDSQRDWFVLYPGQVLDLPGAPASEKAEENPAPPVSQAWPEGEKSDFLSLNKTDAEEGYQYHLIKKGDSLSKISDHHRVPLSEIIEANRIKNPDKVKYGKMLKIPLQTQAGQKQGLPFMRLNRKDKVRYLKERTIKAGHPYIPAIVEVSAEYSIDPRLYASLIWEESWFNANARSQDNCRRLAQLDPRFHTVSTDIKKNFRRSLGYLRHEFVYYREQGFDKKSAAICALAAYNGGNTRIRNYVRVGKWDGKSIETIPLKETRDHLRKIMQRCENNYQAVL